MIGNKRRLDNKGAVEHFKKECITPEKIKSVLEWFGISYNNEYYYGNPKYHIFDNSEDFENSLERLCNYMLGDTREVHYHLGRMIPYIVHKEFCSMRYGELQSDKPDTTGLLTHYTIKDYFFMWFVDFFTSEINKGTTRNPKIYLCFVDVDWFIENTEKGKIKDAKEDKPISDMFVDFLFW